MVTVAGFFLRAFEFRYSSSESLDDAPEIEPDVEEILENNTIK